MISLGSDIVALVTAEGDLAAATWLDDSGWVNVRRAKGGMASIAMKESA